eukprot:Nitzschia sp. Nitz4//scaffold31_size150131//2320//3033//NITZ4_002806-RA/size150131-processed-gene-0.215-mRNA-1//-1//CDS//3329547593//7179//frame0
MPPLSHPSTSEDEHSCLLEMEEEESPVSLDQTKDLQTSPQHIVQEAPELPIEEVSVRFKPTVSIFEVESAFCFSDEEWGSTYYNPLELHNIKVDLLHASLRMQKGAMLDDECSRGLEKTPTKEQCKTRITRANSIQAVLSEQFKQKQTGESDPDVIRDYYISCVRQSKLEALQKAGQDMIDAQHHQKQYDVHCSNPALFVDETVESETKICWFIDISQILPWIARRPPPLVEGVTQD